MRPLVPLAILCALAAGCATAPSAPGWTPPEEEKPSGPSAAVVYEKRVLKVSKTPDPSAQEALQRALDLAFAEASTGAGGKPAEIGFTYTVAPKGHIHPFSDVEVACLLQEKHRGSAAGVCARFFSALEAEMKKYPGANP